MTRPAGTLEHAPSRTGNVGKPLCRRTVLAAGSTAAFAAGLVGCSASQDAMRLTNASPGPRTQRVHLVVRDWHTDVDLPADRLPTALLPLAYDFPGAAHFLFGFGERAYWTRPDPSSSDALAALLPGRGVILVTGLRVPPTAAFPPDDVVVLPVTENGLDRLAGFLAHELREDGAFRRMADGPYPGSRFYATSRRYSATYTCNTWTADALQIAQTGVSASGTIFARQLMNRARAAARRTALTIPSTSAGQTT